jgi:hypothetical protein
MHPRLTYANVMSTIAVFLALGGVSYAAITIPPNSVGTAQLKPHTVGTKQLKNDAVGNAQLKSNSIGVFDYLPHSVTSRAIAPGSIDFADLVSGTVSPDLYAHVAADGTLGDFTGVNSSARTGVGTYRVEFDQNVDGCVAVASVGTAYSDVRLGVPPTVTPGAVAQASINGVGPDVGVTVYTGSGAAVNSEFNLVVLC